MVAVESMDWMALELELEETEALEQGMEEREAMLVVELGVVGYMTWAMDAITSRSRGWSCRLIFITRMGFWTVGRMGSLCEKESLS